MKENYFNDILFGQFNEYSTVGFFFHLYATVKQNDI